MADVYWVRKTDSQALRRLVEPFLPLEGLESTDLVAVKVHPGEAGNSYYVKPRLVGDLVRALELPEASTFLTDTTVLYRGRRMIAPDYVRLAAEHGFAPPTTPPFIVADGLRGTDEVEVELPPVCATRMARLGRLFREVDAMVVVSHFKGHLLAGFGGAIKNLGMGCASRGGKLYQHSTVTPQVQPGDCVACGVCAEHCPAAAIQVESVARVDEERCIGCGECLQRCPTGAMSVAWNQDKEVFVHRVAEYALAAVRLVPRVLLYVNVVVDVSPDCDCMRDAEPPFVSDLGVLASRDPVALDQACLDLVNSEARVRRPGLSGKGDLFQALRPSTRGQEQLAHAERVGLGSRNYVLHPVES